MRVTRLAPFAVVAAVVLALLVAGSPAVREAVAKDTAAEELKLKTNAATEIAKVVEACVAAGAKTEAVRLLAEATALDSSAPGVPDAKDKVEAMDADADGAATAAQKAVAAARANVAKLYDKLGALEHAPADDARFLDYAFHAFKWEPKPRAGKLVKKAAGSLDSPEPWTGARMLARMRKADPEGAKKGTYDAGEADLGKSGKLMLAAAGNGYVAWVALPRSWKKSGTYPVVVGVEGAGSNFKGYLGGMTAARGSRDVICVTPVSISNTNGDKLNAATYPMYDPAFLEACRNDVAKRMELEGPGMDEILADLHERFGAEEKAFHTGFSGGGIYTYWRLFQAPDKVRGAAPCCANFGGLGLQGAPEVKDGGPPVHLFTGEKDQHRNDVFGQKPGIEGQTDLAEENLKKLGYTRVARTMVPGAGHSALQAQVWEFVDEVLSGKAK